MPLRLRPDIATTDTDDGPVLLDEHTDRYWGQLNPPAPTSYTPWPTATTPTTSPPTSPPAARLLATLSPGQLRSVLELARPATPQQPKPPAERWSRSACAVRAKAACNANTS